MGWQEKKLTRTDVVAFVLERNLQCLAMGVELLASMVLIKFGELVESEDGTVGIASNVESDNVGVVPMRDGLTIHEASSVKVTGKIDRTPIGDSSVLPSLEQPYQWVD